MIRVFVLVLSLVATAMPQSVLAQTDFSPDTLALIDRLDSRLMGLRDDPIDRYLAYDEMKPELAAAAEADEMLPLALAVTNVSLASEVRADYLRRGLEWAALGVGPIETTEAALAFVTAAYFAPERTPPTRAEIYQIGEALDRLTAAGLAVEDLGIHSSPGMLKFMEEAIKAFKAAASLEELKNDEDPDRARIVRDLADLIPASFAPAINGPAVAAFADVLDWNGEMLEASTEGIDLVAEAIERGELDQEAYARVAERIETLAGQGPWDGDTAKEFLKKWAENLPGVGKLIKAVWPADLPEECQAINCDCGNLEFGILTGAYQEECRNAEAGIIRQCRIDKTQGACHPTASGPGAYTPGG